MSRRSWESIAHELAGRLMHHAYCPEGHTEPDADCPFCDDIKAYRAYVTKCHQAGAVPARVGSVGNQTIEAVPIHEVRIDGERWPS